MQIEKRKRQCDLTGEMFEILHKQYKWINDTKIWTGFWVGAEYLDTVGYQVKMPIEKNMLLKDPKPYQKLDALAIVVPRI